MSESVLVFVVEHEALLRASIQDALETGGFSVVMAISAEQAIAMLEAKGATFNALVTDVNLRGVLPGWDVAKRARELTEDMPVIYMTGAEAMNGPPKASLTAYCSRSLLHRLN